MTNITQEHEDEVWEHTLLSAQDSVEALLATMGEEHALYARVSALHSELTRLDAAHTESIDSAYARGEDAGVFNARELEQKAHETIGGVVERWLPRVAEFCQRVERHLGAWHPDEPVAVHEIRKDVHEIPRGWV